VIVIKYRSNSFEFKIAQALVQRCFSNVVIGRYDGHREQITAIEVPTVNGNRSRLLKFLENPNQTLKPPVIAVSKEGFAIDSSRMHSLYDFLKLTSGGTINHQKRRGVPVNIEFEVSAIAKYQADLDQIMTNFIPFFTPSVYVTWKHPKYSDQTIKSQLLWNGNVQIQNPTDIGKGDAELWQMTTTFTFKTYIFAGITADSGSDTTITNINLSGDELFDVNEGGFGQSNFYAVPKSIDINTYKDNVVSGYTGYEYETIAYDSEASGEASGYAYDGFYANGQEDFFVVDHTLFDVTYDGT